MSSEFNSRGHGGQDPEAWPPTTREEMEEVIRLAEIEQVYVDVRVVIDELRQKAQARGIDEAKWMNTEGWEIRMQLFLDRLRRLRIVED
jgi:hypothetical protein